MATIAANLPLSDRHAPRAARSGRQKRRFTAIISAAALAVAASCLLVGPEARADTRGFANLRGDGLAGVFGASNPRNYDATNQTLVDLKGTTYSGILNDYIGMTVGLSGSFSQKVDNDNTVAYTVPGRISFGNVKGSIRDEVLTKDDGKGLTGFTNFGLVPFASLWPFAASYNQNPYEPDCSGYTAISIDGAGSVLGEGGIQASRFINNRLENYYQPAANVSINQFVRLYRSTAEITYVITNNDAAVHSVGIQLTLFPFSDAGTTPSGGVRYFVDPNRGVTERPALFQGADIPDSIFFADQRPDPNYFARFTFRGFRATQPDRVFVTNAGYYVIPGYNPVTDPSNIDVLNAVPAVAVYWDPVSIAPGTSRTIVTYFGNGAATEDLSEDFVTGTEARESLQYNSAAALSRGANSSNPGPADIAPFYTPSTFTIKGGIYNQTLPVAGEGVTLNNVTMSLTLPRGLRLAVLPSGARDVSSKSYGDVRPDSENTPLTWVVEPTGEEYGSLNYQLTVSAPPAGSRTISRTVTVPAAPIKTLTSNAFNLISFPFEFDPILSNNSDAGTILNGIVEPDDTLLNIFEYDKSVEDYRLARKLRPGTAYFYRPQPVNPDGTRNIFLTGARPLANQAPNTNTTATTLQITLSRGWNLIGNPYIYDIPLAFLRFVPLDNNPSLRSFSYNEAVNSAFLRGAVFFYTGMDANNPYDFLASASDPLRPWVGYWIFANSPLTILFSPPAQLSSAVVPAPGTDPFPGTRAQRGGVIAGGRALAKQPTLGNWKLQIVARNRAGRRDNSTLIGVAPGASDGDDVRDLPKPPPFRNYVYVGIERQEATGSRSRWAQDLKAPGGGEKSWDLAVDSDIEGPVTLSWPNTANLPRLLRLQVRDTVTGRTYDLRRSSSLTVNLTKSTPRRFRVVASQAPSRALGITNLRVVPSGRAAGAGYRFDFDLTNQASVNVRILTLGNAVKQTLATGRAVAAGANSFRWNGRGQAGEALPVGPYQVEVTARNDNGELVVKRATVLMLR